MFVPRIYQVDEERWPIEIIDRYPLAVLTTNGIDVPNTTHVPVVLPPHHDRLVGAELIAHMNRANPHWAALSDGQAAKLVFHGPQGYVTPSVYHVAPAVLSGYTAIQPRCDSSIFDTQAPVFGLNVSYTPAPRMTRQ